MPPVQSARPYDQNRSIDDRLIDFQLWRKSFSGSQAMTPVTTRLSLGCCNVAHLSGSICMFSFLPRFPALGEVFLCKPVDRTSHPLRLWFNRGCFLLPRSHHCGSPPKFKAWHSDATWVLNYIILCFNKSGKVKGKRPTLVINVHAIHIFPFKIKASFYLWKNDNLG